VCCVVTMVFAESIPVLRKGTEAIGIVRTELARFPVRALVLIIVNLVLISILSYSQLILVSIS
jgi:hypothetical protein